MDHGHITLINFINKQDNCEGKTIIEVGTVREFLDGQNSTECFIQLCIEKKMKLITIDMDEKCSDNARFLCDKYNFKDCEIITSKGEDYLKNINTFDYIYLDGYDYDHGKHSNERNERYNINLNKEINDKDCWESHLLMCKELVKIANINSIICFDDIISKDIGKGVTAIPYLLDSGWKELCEARTNTSILFVHPNKEIKKRKIYVVGNGRSLKDFDFNFLKNKEWVGMCLAFRDWERTGIFPTHYVCVDSIVCNHHRHKILEMVKQKKCETFFICHSLFKSDIGEELQKHENVKSIQMFAHSKENPYKYLVDYCSGSSAVLYAYCLGAKEIDILGIDCKYVEFLPECIEQEDGTLRIIEQPKDNPNYYFNDYQQVGDIYNKPNVDRVHKSSFWDLRNIILLFNILRSEQIKIYNYNSHDTLDNYFERKNLINLK